MNDLDFLLVSPSSPSLPFRIEWSFQLFLSVPLYVCMDLCVFVSLDTLQWLLERQDDPRPGICLPPSALCLESGREVTPKCQLR